jgi:hypothetical protein
MIGYEQLLVLRTLIKKWLRGNLVIGWRQKAEADTPTRIHHKPSVILRAAAFVLSFRERYETFESRFLFIIGTVTLIKLISDFLEKSLDRFRFEHLTWLDKYQNLVKIALAFNEALKTIDEYEIQKNVSLICDLFLSFLHYLAAFITVAWLIRIYVKKMLLKQHIADM